MAALGYVAAVFAHVLSARPERLWPLALMPLLALAIGRPTGPAIVAALSELGLLAVLHSLLTLIRAARLEGG